jgi:chorismate synthase
MLRFLTAGESHGPMLTAILEGMPAGLPLAPDDLARDMARRQQGYGSGGRMQIERDMARITGGVMNGLTTGGPIGLLIENRDWKNWAERDIAPMTTPRPGHADLTGTIKYGYRDLRLAPPTCRSRPTIWPGSPPPKSRRCAAPIPPHRSAFRRRSGRSRSTGTRSAG